MEELVSEILELVKELSLTVQSQTSGIQELKKLVKNTGKKNTTISMIMMMKVLLYFRLRLMTNATHRSTTKLEPGPKPEWGTTLHQRQNRYYLNYTFIKPVGVAGCLLHQPDYSLGLMLKPLRSVGEFPVVDGRISAKSTEKSRLSTSASRPRVFIALSCPFQL